MGGSILNYVRPGRRPVFRAGLVATAALGLAFGLAPLSVQLDGTAVEISAPVAHAKGGGGNGGDNGGGNGGGKDNDQGGRKADNAGDGNGFGRAKGDEMKNEARGRYANAQGGGNGGGHGKPGQDGDALGEPVITFNSQETDSLLKQGWVGFAREDNQFLNNGDRVRTMVAIAKELGLSPSVGAMQAKFGTPQENGLLTLQAQIAADGLDGLNEDLAAILAAEGLITTSAADADAALQTTTVAEQDQALADLEAAQSELTTALEEIDGAKTELEAILGEEIDPALQEAYDDLLAAEATLTAALGDVETALEPLSDEDPLTELETAELEAAQTSTGDAAAAVDEALVSLDEAGTSYETAIAEDPALLEESWELADLDRNGDGVVNILDLTDPEPDEPVEEAPVP